jgi:hypothetical protein
MEGRLGRQIVCLIYTFASALRRTRKWPRQWRPKLPAQIVSQTRRATARQPAEETIDAALT